MQGRSSWQSEEEEEGHLETKPVHYSTGQSTEHQLPENLQSSQETIVGGLKRRMTKEKCFRRKTFVAGDDEAEEEWKDALQTELNILKKTQKQNLNRLMFLIKKKEQLVTEDKRKLDVWYAEEKEP